MRARVEANDFKPQIAEFMHEPWRHRSGLDPQTCIISRMPADQNPDLFWNGGALAPPQSAASIVDDANRRRLLRNVQSDPTKQVIDEAPKVRITDNPARIAALSIGKSSTNRDYRMSTYDNADSTHSSGSRIRATPSSVSRKVETAGTPLCVVSRRVSIQLATAPT